MQTKEVKAKEIACAKVQKHKTAWQVRKLKIIQIYYNLLCKAVGGRSWSENKSPQKKIIRLVGESDFGLTI